MSDDWRTFLDKWEDWMFSSCRIYAVMWVTWFVVPATVYLAFWGGLLLLLVLRRAMCPRRQFFETQVNKAEVREQLAESDTTDFSDVP